MDDIHGDVPHLPDGFRAAAAPKPAQPWTDQAAVITLAGLGGLGSLTMFI